MSPRSSGTMTAGFLLSAEKAGRQRRYPDNMQSVKKKYYFNFYASCGSTHKIEFAEQIHKFREHVSRNLYKGRKNVPVRRGFSSKFDRKRGFDREAARKTLVFRQPQAADFRLRLRSRLPGPANLRCLSQHNLRCVCL